MTYNAFELFSATGLVLFGYIAAAQSPAEEGLRLLASWVATEQQRQLSEGRAVPGGAVP